MPDTPELAKELNHVLRAKPPWRSWNVTECGLSPVGRSIVTLDELEARVKKIGLQRAQFLMCLTCWNTARWYTTWEHNPVRVYARDFDAQYSPRASLLRRELEALGALYRAHAAEFEEIMAAMDNPEVDDLHKARQRKQGRQGRRGQR
jgi:hypothetical protein